MKSKIRQISISGGTVTTPDVIYALCEDGSVWWYEVCKGNKGWVEIPTQDKEESE